MTDGLGMTKLLVPEPDCWRVFELLSACPRPASTGRGREAFSRHHRLPPSHSISNTATEGAMGLLSCKAVQGSPSTRKFWADLRARNTYAKSSAPGSAA